MVFLMLDVGHDHQESQHFAREVWESLLAPNRSIGIVDVIEARTKEHTTAAMFLQE